MEVITTDLPRVDVVLQGNVERGAAGEQTGRVALQVVAVIAATFKPALNIYVLQIYFLVVQVRSSKNGSKSKSIFQNSSLI